MNKEHEYLESCTVLKAKSIGMVLSKNNTEDSYTLHQDTLLPTNLSFQSTSLKTINWILDELSINTGPINENNNSRM